MQSNVGASLLAKAVGHSVHFIQLALFNRTQKRPLFHKSGLSEVAKDRRKSVKFR
jgi:hypothetical protein